MYVYIFLYFLHIYTIYFFVLEVSALLFYIDSYMETFYIDSYMKTLRTFNDFCNDFSRVVYCCYLRAVRSTWTRLALKAAIDIRKFPWIWYECTTHGRMRGYIRLPKKVPFFITALFRYCFRQSYTRPRCAVCCTLIPNL